MVSLIERSICLSGLLCLYSYGIYKYAHSKTQFDKEFHDAAVIQANKFINSINNENLKFVYSPNKILFLLGIENNDNFLKDSNMLLIDELIENFTPNYFVYEKNMK